MRLFIAIDLDPDVRSAAGRVSRELARQLDEAGREQRITWVPPDRMHLTIGFLGEVDAARLDQLRGVLEEPLSIAPFDLAFSGVGAFPPAAPKVIWIGVSGGLDRVRTVHSAIDSRLEPLGIAREERRFRPHLTLARVRQMPRGPDRVVRQVLDRAQANIGTSRVERVTLYESRLSPNGPEYRPFLQTSLRPD